MVKNTKIGREHTGENERLETIANTKFGVLSDDEVLALLAERKHLEILQREYAAQKKEEEERERERARIEKENAQRQNSIAHKKAVLIQSIETLNQSISPDKTDTELLTFVKQRRALEKELEALGSTQDTVTMQSPSIAPAPESTPLSPVEPENAAVSDEQNGMLPETAPSTPETTIPVSVVEKKETEPQVSSFKEELKEDFGRERIQDNDFTEGSELHRYLDQLKNNIGSLGTLLQEMPANAKKNKAFMLKVAEIDPAYAMHYADAGTLKIDEDFNIRIASMKNPRNSGNALAEMLPEARTSNVVLAAVKQDYKNVKFIQPHMEAYDEILSIAKRSTLERLKELKEAADMLLIVPRPLQEDKQFMEEAKRAMSGKMEEEESTQS